MRALASEAGPLRLGTAIVPWGAGSGRSHAAREAMLALPLRRRVHLEGITDRAPDVTGGLPHLRCLRTGEHADCRLAMIG